MRNVNWRGDVLVNPAPSSNSQRFGVRLKELLHEGFCATLIVGFYAHPRAPLGSSANKSVIATSHQPSWSPGASSSLEASWHPGKEDSTFLEIDRDSNSNSRYQRQTPCLGMSSGDRLVISLLMNLNLLAGTGSP